MIVGTSTNCSAVCSAKRTRRLRVRTGCRRDLGHFDNLLGNEDIEKPAYVHQLVFHLRHRNIKRRNEEHGCRQSVPRCAAGSPPAA